MNHWNRLDVRAATMNQWNRFDSGTAKGTWIERSRSSMTLRKSTGRSQRLCWEFTERTVWLDKHRWLWYVGPWCGRTWSYRGNTCMSAAHPWVINAVKQFAPQDLQTSRLKCWKVKMLKCGDVEMLNILECWKVDILECWDVEVCIKSKSTLVQYLNVQTFPTLQVFNISTF